MHPDGFSQFILGDFFLCSLILNNFSDKLFQDETYFAVNEGGSFDGILHFNTVYLFVCNTTAPPIAQELKTLKIKQLSV
jgi:hypothetical protein